MDLSYPKIRPSYLSISVSSNNEFSLYAGLWDIFGGSSLPAHRRFCKMLEKDRLFAFANMGMVDPDDPKPFCFDDGFSGLDWLLKLIAFCKQHHVVIDLNRENLMSYGGITICGASYKALEFCDYDFRRIVDTYLTYMHYVLSAVSASYIFDATPVDCLPFVAAKSLLIDLEGEV